MVPGWLIITLVLLGIMIFLFRSANQVYLLSLVKNNFFYYFMIALFAFLAISFTRLYVLHDLDFTSYAGFLDAMKVYGIWLKGVFVNLGRVTGYAVNQEWIPSNVTNMTR